MQLTVTTTDGDQYELTETGYSGGPRNQAELVGRNGFWVKTNDDLRTEDLFIPPQAIAKVEIMEV